MNYKPNCKCDDWATDNLVRSMLGNGHHYRCDQFIPDVGSIDLIKMLVKGIKEWGANEDGVADEVWEAFKKAVFITEGKVLSDKKP